MGSTYSVLYAVGVGGVSWQMRMVHLVHTILCCPIASLAAQQSIVIGADSHIVFILFFSNRSAQQATNSLLAIAASAHHAQRTSTFGPGEARFSPMDSVSSYLVIAFLQCVIYLRPLTRLSPRAGFNPDTS